jgi:hypothetical protein
MKYFALIITLAATLLVGCNRPPEQPVTTPLPPAPTAVTTEEGALPTDEPAPPTSTAPVPATDTVAPTVESTAEPPTEAPTATEPPTDEPSPEASPTVEPTATMLPTPVPSPASFFGPGQQDGASLADGSAMTYLVQGTAFQPLILFVEPTNELNVALSAYRGDVSNQTTPEGVTPLASADNTLAGRPEILVLSPEVNGVYTLVVRAAAGEGSFIAHLFDLTTPAPGVVVQQPDTLATGGEKSYNVTSNGPRPVIAVADPTDQSDLALDILSADGTVLTTANFSGPGGVETAYVLPLGTTTYTIRVREANGGASEFQIAVIALE